MFYSLIRSGVDFYDFTAALSNKALKEPGLVVICLSAGLASYVAVENVRRLCLLVAVDLAFISYALFFKATPHDPCASVCATSTGVEAQIFVRLPKFDAGLLTQVKENLGNMTDKQVVKQA